MRLLQESRKIVFFGIFGFVFLFFLVFLVLVFLVFGFGILAFWFAFMVTRQQLRIFKCAYANCAFQKWYTSGLSSASELFVSLLCK